MGDLLGTANPKTQKGEKYGFRTSILHLAPANLSGYEVCPSRSPGCTSSCLNTSGRGPMSNIQAARVRKTKMFFENRKEFMQLLKNDIKAAKKSAKNFQIDDTPSNRALARKRDFAEADGTLGKVKLGKFEVLSKEERLQKFGYIDDDEKSKTFGELIVKRGDGKIDYPLQAVFRPNGTSDIAWEDILIEPVEAMTNLGRTEIWSKRQAQEMEPLNRGEMKLKTIMDEFPDDIFYDYTKEISRCDDNSRNRADKTCKTFTPSNYGLTFSRSETNQKLVEKAMDRGQNVAVVFDNREGLPKTWNGRRVINGDDSDLRFMDPKRVVVGLLAKGRARGGRDTSGFVVYDGTLSQRLKQNKAEDLYRPLTPTMKGIGERKMGKKVHIPIQQNVSRSRAKQTAERIRRIGKGARVVSHAERDGSFKPTGRTKWAVYTPRTGTISACPT